jgi:hypothetical protein
MSSPNEQSTRALKVQTVERPAVTTAPATRRARVWQRKLPPRIGRARTSTVVIGCLFVLLFALNSTLPQEDTGTTPVTTSDGRTIRVPNSALPSDARSTPTPTAPATAQTPEESSSAPTARAPATTGGDERAPATPATGTAAPTTSAEPGRQRSTAAPTTSRAPAATSRAPAATATSDQPGTTTAPTS